MAGMYGCFKSRNSDSAAMASGPPDVMTNQEPAEVVEECSGKKKSKFQTFKKFFARKKRKEPPAAGADAELKASQSSDNVSKTSENNALTRSEKEKGSGSKISLGNKALSHDSVFVSDSSEANEALGASQDNIHGKVKSLQLQLRQAIRLGSPPSLMCVKKADDGGAMSEDDGLPCSPPELTTLHTAMNQAQRNSTISLEGIDTDDDQLSCPASSRAVSPLVVPGDFSQPASPFGCLDNSAAKHKLGLRHKACNRRKPVRKLELKADGDSEVDTLNTSIAEASEEQHQRKTTEVVSGDELKPKEDEKEDEEEEEEQEPDASRLSLSRDEEERKEEEDESRAEQDVSHGLDSSSPPEEEAPDVQPSSKPSSRASSLDSPGATPEPPAGPTEYSLDAPGVSYRAEDTEVEGDLALSGEEDGVQESREEESSFLQEVLSSLKTPLSSSSLCMEAEGVVLEIQEEVKEKEREDVEREDGEEVKEEEEEPVSYQAAPAGSLLSDQTTEEEEEEEVVTLSTTSYQDVEEEEKVEDKEEEAAAEEEELVVERVNQHGQQEEAEEEEAEEEEAEEEEAEEVTPEEQNYMLTGHAVNQAEVEGREEEGEEESEGEEEAIELVKEPEVEEVGREKREEEEVEVDVKEAAERVEETEEAVEERDSLEEETEMFPDAAGEDDAMLLQEEDEGVDVVGDEAVCSLQHSNDDETEPGDAAVQESQAEEREDGEEEMEEGVEIDHIEQKSEQVEDQSEEDEQQEDVETSHLDVKQVDQNEATEQVNVPSKPPPLTLPESHQETQPQESGASTPSKTTTIHINLLSPSSDKSPSFFQQSPTEALPEIENEIEQSTASREEEEAADDVEAVEEENQSDLEEEATSPGTVEEEEEEVTQPSSGSDQSTFSPSWQRSLSREDAEESLPSPSSPPACFSPSPSAITGPGGLEVEATTSPEVKAEPASPSNVEVVLSPGRVRSAGTITTPSPSSIQPQTSAAATTESSVIVEGNPDNPFGIRLRKTSALHRFSSEEENSEPPIEPPAQPTSCKVDSPQPISVKPSISPPVSNKPSLPKKPDVHGDSGGKNKRLSDPAAGRGVSGGSDSPSWISVAKQKQKIYKENSLEEITVRKEEPERKSSLPMYVSSAASREHSNRTAESTSKVSPLELSKPSVEKEARRSFSPPTPVPPQPPKSQSLPCPVPPKPQLPPAITNAKHPPQPSSPQRSLSPTSPIPVPLKSPSSTSPLSPSKTSTQSTTLTSPPFSSRTASQTPASQRGLPPPASPKDEPPWMALAKKKAKAWSEMPQIVQ